MMAQETTRLRKGGEKKKITDEEKEKAMEEIIKRLISHEAGHEGYFYARDLDTPNLFREYFEKPERQNMPHTLSFQRIHI